MRKPGPARRDSLAAVLRDTRALIEDWREDGIATVDLGPAPAAPAAVPPRAPRRNLPASTDVAAARPVAKPAASSLPKAPAVKPAPPPVPQAAAPAPAVAGPDAPRLPAAKVQAELDRVAAEVAACRRCDLYKTRTKPVPGQGSPAPDILFVGEAPGADEDLQGLAFVGRAGQLLTQMIVAMGYTRDEVFIANICKSRPPNNRTPLPEEMEACLPYLRRQIAVLRPRVIVALGATAVKGLLKTETGITRLRGTWCQFDGIPVMPTFHPAYLLRNPPAKREAWADLQAVLKRLGRTAPDWTKKGKP